MPRHTAPVALYGGPEFSRRVESSVMSNNASLFPFAAAGVTAFALVASLFVSSGFAHAGNSAAASGLCPKSGDTSLSLKLDQPALNEVDEIAALEKVQLALTEVADGSTYVWHRNNGRLSGVIQPVSSFKDTKGAVCRHAVVVLSTVKITKRTEIVACRLPTGIWQLES